MTILNSATRLAVRPFAGSVSSKTHAVLDYLTVGSFLLSGAWLWRRNRHAAMASLALGGTGLAVALLTDYPGGVEKAIRFRSHMNIEYGLAAMTATVPSFLGLYGAEKRFFLAQGVMMTATNELTRRGRVDRGQGKEAA